MSLVLKAQVATFDEGMDTDISSGIGLHVPRYTQLLAETCHQYGVHPIERLMVRRHGTSSSLIRETYNEPCSTLEAAQACKQWFQPIWGSAPPFAKAYYSFPGRNLKHDSVANLKF
ncbi:hypothetical protein Tco_0314052 [Tanacetum coccineum]